MTLRILAIVVLLVPSAWGQTPSATIERVGWLQGCWTTAPTPGVPERGGVIDENWMAPRGGVMLGMSRTVREGKLLEYELVVLREQDGRLAYHAHPSGQASAVFLSTSVTESSVLFENPQHDFPQKVGYRRDGEALVAWVEGTTQGKPRRVEFPYRRARCPV